ncbi:MAG: hypothetical protein ACR2KO_07285 [Geodermatophilaceae bacterium]
MAVGEDWRIREDEALVVVPPDELDQLLKVIGRLGGDSVWGVRERAYGTGIVVAQFVDQLIVAAVKALNEIVRLTPVEALPDIDLSDMTDISRRHSPHALNSSQMRSRIRLLAGFSGFEPANPMRPANARSSAT